MREYVYNMPNGSSFTTSDYMKELEGGYITRRVHPKFSNIVILNYTNLAIYEKRWNTVTEHSRGLIINEDEGTILALPFKKFFNYGEMECIIPVEEEVEITVKQDGSLGISYFLDGEINWSTKGTFESEQAYMAKKIWDDKYSHLNIVGSTTTLLVEIIYPKNRIVVDYGEMTDLVLLGAYDLITGKEFSYDDLKVISNNLGMPLTERFIGSLDDLLEVVENLDSNNEGFVAHWRKSGLRLKFKGEEYLKIHRIAYGLSYKRAVQYWKDGELRQLIESVPEEFRRGIESVANKCDILFNVIKDNATHVFKEIPKAFGRKQFSLWVQSELQFSPDIYSKLMYMLLDNKDIDSYIKDYIYKNYDEILGE